MIDIMVVLSMCITIIIRRNLIMIVLKGLLNLIEQQLRIQAITFQQNENWKCYRISF